MTWLSPVNPEKVESCGVMNSRLDRMPHGLISMPSRRPGCSGSPAGLVEPKRLRVHPGDRTAAATQLERAAVHPWPDGGDPLRRVAPREVDAERPPVDGVERVH